MTDVRINLFVTPDDGLLYDQLKGIASRKRAERLKRAALIGFMAERGAVPVSAAPVPVSPAAAPERGQAASGPKRPAAAKTKIAAAPAASLPAEPSPPAQGALPLDDEMGDNFLGSVLGFQGTGR